MQWPTPWRRPVRVISGEGDDPDRGLRLFWCVVITLIPLSILFTGASLETMKTTVVLYSPSLPRHFTGEKVGGFIRWLKQDYADIPAHQVEHYLPQTPVEAPRKTRSAPCGNRIQRRQLSAIILTIKVSL